MRRWLLAIVLLITPATAGAGDWPPYLILRAPVRPPAPQATHGYYPGEAYAVETQAYHYGWFGAKPGKTWQRSTGYHRNFTQWSVR
jgi:hypothetical protein